MKFEHALIGVMAFLVGSVLALIAVDPGQTQFLEPSPPVTQNDLRWMIDEWMNNPEDNDRNQRLEIMKAFYTFEESGQKLSDDRDGRVMYNQIVKMVSFDIPKTELNQIKEEIRNDLREIGFEIES